MLVIFDCDGVLVDSERLASQVFSQQLAKEGIHKTAEECFNTFKGHTLATCLHMLDAEFRLGLSKNFLDELKQSTQFTFEHRLKAVVGVEQVLSQLSQLNIDFCVASNGGLDKIQHSLAVTELWPFFEGKCFSADAVERGKPEPDLFLWAAKEMGYRPSESVVIEDSIAGVHAACSAGMTVFHYAQKKEKVELPAQLATLSQVKYFSDMSQLTCLLGLVES